MTKSLIAAFYLRQLFMIGYDWQFGSARMPTFNVCCQGQDSPQCNIGSSYEEQQSLARWEAFWMKNSIVEPVTAAWGG